MSPGEQPPAGGNDDGPPRPAGRRDTLRLRVALALVSLLRTLVPKHRRSAWAAEWRAEIRHRFDRELAGPAPGPGLLRRSLSAVPHALALLRREGGPEMMWHDLRFAWRRLRRAPGFTAGVILTLAIGIGATTAIFSVVHSTLLDPLPLPGGDRVVFLMKQAPDRSIRTSPRAEDVARWRERAGSFEEIVTYATETVVVTGAGEPVEEVVLRVTPGFFAFLGTGPTLGRGFAPEEGRSDARVAVVSHGFWRTELGGDPEALGRDLTLDGEPWTIVGVMPRGFHFRAPFDSPRIWLPFPADEDHASPWAVARLRPGVSLEAANEELAAITPATDTGFGAGWVGKAQRFQDMLGATYPTAVMALQVAVALLLLVAAANVANLLLAQATGHEQEMAVRAALGAGRQRLARQMLVEHGLLAAGGGLLGLLLARGGLALILTLRPDRLSHLDAVRIDGTVLAFALGVSALTGLIFGVIPAMRASRPDLLGRLAAGSRAGAGRRGSRFRQGLVVGEVALSTLLLVGAGLMINSMGRLLGTDLGFRPDGVLTFSLSLPEARYPDEVSTDAFRDELLRRLRTAAGDRIESVALAGGQVPHMGIVTGTWHAEGEEVLPAFDQNVLMGGSVGPGFFETLEIPLLDGRDFTAADLEVEDTPVIVNAAWARRMWGEEEVAGRRIVHPGSDGAPSILPVVGVVDDARLSGVLNAISDMQLFYPYGGGRYLTTLVRTRGDPEDLAGVVKSQIWSLDPDLPVRELASLESRMIDTLGARRFHTTLLTVFAAVALTLAVVGVYGILAFAVGRRTREIGVRMALGASRRTVLPMVVWHGMRVVLLGLALGIAGAAALTGYMSSLLYEVAPLDPPTYAAVAVVLAAVSAAACWVPARRAAGVDPMVALRTD